MKKLESYLTAILLAVFLASTVANGLPSAMSILNSLSGIQNPQPIQPAVNSLVSQLSASILPSNVNLNELISTLKDTNKNLDQLFKLIDNTNQVFQGLKDYFNPPPTTSAAQPGPIQYGATGGGILTSLRSTLADKEGKAKQAALLNGLFDDINSSHGDIINVNQIVIASNDSLPASQMPMINVDEIRLIYQLIDMFDMSKLIGNESNRRMMLTLLERFQVPKENLLTIELLANLSNKLNDNKKRAHAGVKDKAVLPKSIELVKKENKTGAIEQGKPDKKAGKDKSMKLIQNRRDEMFQRILDLKNRRKLGEQPSESQGKTEVVELPESAIEVKEAESSAIQAASSLPSDPSNTKRSVRALTASATENDPLNMLLKNLVSEETVKQYKWMFDFFKQLQNIKFQ